MARGWRATSWRRADSAVRALKPSVRPYSEPAPASSANIKARTHRMVLRALGLEQRPQIFVAFPGPGLVFRRFANLANVCGVGFRGGIAEAGTHMIHDGSQFRV